MQDSVSSLVARRSSLVDSSRTPSRHAVVICTRNRSEDLGETLGSIAGQEVEFPVEIIVVDASDPEERQANAALPVRYVSYDGEPSSARQRNAGLDVLDGEVDIVHFFDDDITLESGYFEAVQARFEQFPEIGGIGPHIIDEGRRPPVRQRARFWRYLFLLDHPRPGRVLASGEVSSAQTRRWEQGFTVEALSGCCCAFRRSLLDEIRFDAALDGYALDEDLDLSYRIHQRQPLYHDPDVQVIHRRSSQNRYDARRYARDYVVHRYWFLEKNIRHPLRKPAFWWSMMGRLLIATAAGGDWGRERRAGLLEGARLIWRRAHPLLKR